jgi:hypothetical protein
MTTKVERVKVAPRSAQGLGVKSEDELKREKKLEMEIQ